MFEEEEKDEGFLAKIFQKFKPEDEFAHLTRNPDPEAAAAAAFKDPNDPKYWDERYEFHSAALKERYRNRHLSKGFGLPYDTGPVLKTLGHLSKSWDAVADKSNHIVKNAGGALLGFATSSFDTMVAAGGAQVFIGGRHALRETYKNYRHYRRESEETRAGRYGFGKMAWMHTKGVTKTAMPTVKLAGKTAAMMFAAYAGNEVVSGYGGALAALGVGVISSIRQVRIERKHLYAQDTNDNAKSLFYENIAVVGSTLMGHLAGQKELISEGMVNLINSGSATAATVTLIGAGIYYASERIKAKDKENTEALTGDTVNDDAVNKVSGQRAANAR